jgi:CDP-diacylglycerol--glycerol-3-phosphate 3-phosphatidyltransferase
VTGSLVTAQTRQRVRDLAIPVATALGRLGLTPNGLTLIGFAGTAVAAWAAASQWWLAAGILVLAFGIFDLFDGALARATGTASKLGAFLDSTFDRSGEGLVYLGIAVGCTAARFDAGALLAMAALVAAFMVSYVRAKAESLGFAPGSGLMNVGLAPREVRVAILAIGLVWTGLLGGVASDIDFFCNPTICPDADMGLHGGTVMAATLGLITVLATVTVIQRILHVRAQAREG